MTLQAATAERMHGLNELCRRSIIAGVKLDGTPLSRSSSLGLANFLESPLETPIAASALNFNRRDAHPRWKTDSE